ncbi:MAG TPA: sigma factor, partial [Dehalococcoidia bacterium]|nr:sigma factor [Dehalococcoidia bacterium]
MVPILGPAEPVPVTPAPASTFAEAELIEALRRGDEATFAALIDRYHPSLIRLATIYCGSRQVGEEVAQDAWLGFLQSLDRFEGRSSLKTWLFRILINCAKSRARREGRSLPFSALAPGSEHDEPAVDPERFWPPDHPDLAGHWAAPPRSW